MRYLGLDLGSKTLGVSVSDKNGIIASSLETIHHNEDYSLLVLKVKELVESLEIDKIVLGFPKMMNNDIGEKGKLSLKFKEELEKNINIEVYLQDERLTTKSAEDILIKGNMSRKKRKKVIDSVAATIILQSYLERNVK